MSPLQPGLVARAALPEQYDGFSLFVFATTPLLLSMPWWLLLMVGCIVGPVAALTARS